MVDAVGKEVPKLLVSPDTNDSVKQCAALCVLKLFRLKTDILPPGEWTSRIVQLLNDKHLVSKVQQCRNLHLTLTGIFIVHVNSIFNACPAMLFQLYATLIFLVDYLQLMIIYVLLIVWNV